MDFTRTTSQRALREEYFQAGRDLVRPGAAERDAAGTFDRGLWQRVAATGLLGLHLPGEVGGRGLPPWDAVAAFEGFAAGCEDAGFLVALLAHAGLVQASLSSFGTPEQQMRWLPGLVNGSLIGCFAITEKECGSDVRAIRLSATPEPDGAWRLNGAKWNITNAPVADVCLTFARVAGRVSKPVGAFLTDLRTPGVTRSAPFDLMGHRTTPIGALTFENHRVSPDGVIGDPRRGLRILDFAFGVERVLTGIGIASCLEPVIEECLRYVQEREAFGHPIGEYQYVQGHIVEMAAGMELLRSTAWRAMDALLRGEECSSLASVVKLHAAETFHRATVNAVRVFGNHGYRRGGVIERFCRDGVGILLAGGTSEIHRNIIWRNLKHRPSSGRAVDQAI
jgi:alkylation response protein AidB-like acyl-CoA dehydrogenase